MIGAVATKFLDDTARAAFRRAVEAIESVSAVEVVIAVRRRSAAYHHAHAIVGAAAAFAGLAAMLFSSHSFQLTSILVDPFVVAAFGAGVVVLLPDVQRALTSPATRHAAVLRAARATFIERGAHATTGRTGLLIYISWLERQIALVGDIGLARALPADFLMQAETTLTATMRAGGTAVARDLERLADAMAKALPRSHSDENELPDGIDSDLERRR